MQDIREQEAKRFADLGQRLRSQREEAEQKKKEGQVKFTDRLQPPRRRGCEYRVHFLKYSTSTFCTDRDPSTTQDSLPEDAIRRC